MAHWKIREGSMKAMMWRIGGDEVAYWRRWDGSLEEMRWLIGGDEVL